METELSFSYLYFFPVSLKLFFFFFTLTEQILHSLYSMKVFSTQICVSSMCFYCNCCDHTLAQPDDLWTVIIIIFHGATLCISETFRSLYATATTLAALKAPVEDILWLPCYIAIAHPEKVSSTAAISAKTVGFRKFLYKGSQSHMDIGTSLSVATGQDCKWINCFLLKIATELLTAKLENSHDLTASPIPLSTTGEQYYSLCKILWDSWMEICFIPMARQTN